MADVKISELPVATEIDPLDVIPIVQNGITKQAETQLLGKFKETSTTLDNSQILSLPTVPVEVIPAQGANTLINLLSICVVQYWPDAYGTLSADPHLRVQISGLAETRAFLVIDDATYGFFSGAWGSGGIRGISSTTGGIFVNPAQVAGIISEGDFSVLNLPIVVQVDNGGSGNFSLGGANNTLKLICSYTVTDVS